LGQSARGVGAPNSAACAPPGLVTSLTGTSAAISAACIASDCERGTSVSASPCSSSTGGDRPLTCVMGDAAEYAALAEAFDLGASMNDTT
jgi:hypothetical protein